MKRLYLVSWTTDTATTGYVVYEVDGSFMGRVSTSGAAATTHTVWLAATAPSTTYNYYVIAANPSTGAIAVSAIGSATTTDGVLVSSEPMTPSPGQMQISGSTDTPVLEAIEYAQVGPGISSIQWQRAEHGYKDQDHTFTLTGLQPNAEYAYRFVTAADGTWANSTKGAFSWFTTKTAPSSVAFTNLADGEGVTSLADITVQAGDPIHRFSSYGITSVELYVDDVPVGSYDVTPGTDSVVYTFHAGTLTDGLHQLHAVAYDDFWQETDADIQVLVGSSGGLQPASVSKKTPLVTLASQSRTGRDKFRRVAQNLSRTFKLGYRAGPRLVGGKKKGSIGYLYLRMSMSSGWTLLGCWRASSGQSWNWKSSIGTMPPGTWRTWPHPRVGGHVEGESKPNFGAYLIHVQPHPRRVRHLNRFHIHGNWGPPYSKIGVRSDGSKYHIPIGGEVYYRYSDGCIILHRSDLVNLKNRWQTYVLHGAQHGASSGIPLRVQYFDKQVTP